MVNKPDVLTGVLLEEETEFTLVDLGQACSVNTEWIILLVKEGIIDPVEETDAMNWRFPGTSLQRVRTARRLHHDLGLNLAGIALALDLLDEIEILRQRINTNKRD